MPAVEGLRATGLTVRFGALTVLHDVDLAVPPGAVTGLVGPPGAGKTAFADAVTGLVRAAGTVRLDGADLTGAAPRVRARHGLARTSAAAAPFGSLTVRDNVRAAVEIHARTRPVAGRGWRDVRSRRKALRQASGATADALLARTGIAAHAGRAASAVPPGTARLLDIARALATRPRVLLLDDPSAGLPVPAARALEVLLRELAAEGVAVLVADRDLDRVLGVCDTLYVLDRGRVVAAGPPARVRADPGVRAAFARR
ncbi:Lipopolysaccharide export system ATP-binding protein LptB [Actinomadura rubteroloni]|uniref:Lipopolysaccharide export system ATP-binding protein LptB n=1 Tax=Actinomadura rubteroloni TaxID=1926885 RepID=A0A2P4UBM3_9ACTN|nr:ATP-binding cassette domain-containing protein [Actinomadura rubteroloni]POM22445.1 Lipopolysaccharide export system ATP-binding protein LptB [Actinomadura rubteroloni]